MGSFQGCGPHIRQVIGWPIPKVLCHHHPRTSCRQDRLQVQGVVTLLIFQLLLFGSLVWLQMINSRQFRLYILCYQVFSLWSPSQISESFYSIRFSHCHTNDLQFYSSLLVLSSSIPLLQPDLPIPIPTCPKSTHKICSISPSQGDSYAPPPESSLLLSFSRSTDCVMVILYFIVNVCLYESKYHVCLSG